MDVLAKLNEPEFEKPYRGFAKLPIGYYKVVNFRESFGKFGRSVIAELEKEITFLPSYLSCKLNEEDIRKLNKKEEDYYLFFGGKLKKKKYWSVKLLSHTDMMAEDTEEKIKQAELNQEKSKKKRKRMAISSSSSSSSGSSDEEEGDSQSQPSQRKFASQYIDFEATEEKAPKKKYKKK